MYGRRYSDGLHQAIEAKEKLNVRSESKTLATITFQNYFRMYEKLSGMTGTAKTEEDEFREIYNMDVVEIPTNEPIARDDLADSIYMNQDVKFDAVVREIKERHATGQPVLVGTITIETSEMLSRYLKKEGIEHEVLNAKYHEREAEIVAQAGRFNSVTIATNMAGRGTDIVLGGNPDFLAKLEMKKKGFTDETLSLVDSFYDVEDPEVLEAREVYAELVEKYKAETDIENKKVIEAGGLHIIGTERHESRRIDNQLRGRAGRQGDPGSTRFYISLEDDLMRLFAGDRFRDVIDKMNMPEDEALEHSLLTKTIEGAQKKVEGNNFGIRKHVLKYDDVMNQQREVIYGERRKVLEGEDLRSHIMEMSKNLIAENIEVYTRQAKYPEEWDIEGLEDYAIKLFGIPKGTITKLDRESLTKEILEETILDKAEQLYKLREAEFGEDRFREVERVILLQVVDSKWMDHIDAMDQFRQGIGLRAMGQEDPIRAYQMEGFDMFDEMTHSISEDTVTYLFHVQNPDKLERKRVAQPLSTSSDEPQKPIVNKEKKIGRNDPCPCGSGKKYKRCCGQ
jgi:preprotein translocase subunit SecA